MANPLIVANLVALLKFGDFGYYGDFAWVGQVRKICWLGCVSWALRTLGFWGLR